MSEGVRILSDALWNAGYLGPNGVLSGVDVVNGELVLSWTVPPDDPQRIAAQALIDSIQWRTKRVPRPVWVLLQEYNALPGNVRSQAYSDLTSGNPPKWSTSAGPNKAALTALYFLTVQPGGSPTSVDQAKSYLAAAYAQDNPQWLINPPFAPSVNIPGDEEVPVESTTSSSESSGGSDGPGGGPKK